MDQASYIVPDRARAEALAATAESQLAEADRASTNSTKFVLVAVVLALVLLFASVATKFSTPKIQVILICVSMLLLAMAFIRMLTLPLRP